MILVDLSVAFCRLGSRFILWDLSICGFSQIFFFAHVDVDLGFPET